MAQAVPAMSLDSTKLFEFDCFLISDCYSIGTVARVYIWESAEISATIMATSIPMLRKLALSATRRGVPRENEGDVVLSNFRRQLRMINLRSEGTESTKISSPQPLSNPETR